MGNNMKKKSTQPLFRKIKQYILGRIEKGEWKTGAKISSEAELVAHFSTSRMTVNRAVRELTAEGRLVRKQGKGTYVASLKPKSAFLEISSIAQEIRKSGGTIPVTFIAERRKGQPRARCRDEIETVFICLPLGSCPQE